MVKVTALNSTATKPAPKPAPKPKLTFWEEMRTKGIASAVTNEIKDLEMAVTRKEKAIVTKEAAAKKLRLDAEILRSEVATLKVRIFRKFFEIVKVRYLAKSQKSS